MMLLTGCVERTFVFFPSTYPAGNWQPEDLEFEDVWFSVDEGSKLHGWYLSADEPRGYLVYSHGNAGNLSDRAGLVRILNRQLGLSVLIFDYRGYGRSDGRPSIDGILEDGVAAAEWLRHREGIQPQQIIFMGHSLGALVAVNTAVAHGARGLILEGAFSSLRDLGRQAYPWLPTGLLLRRDIPAAKLIQKFDGPLLQSHGTADSIVPLSLGRKLFKAAPGPKQFIELKGLNHNDPPPIHYYQTINQFIESLL